MRGPKSSLRAVVALSSLAVLAAACSSTTTSSAKPSSSTSTTSVAATVKVATSPYGKILVGTSGNTLYTLTADTPTTSACAGACLTIWPPLTVTGKPTAGPGVNASMLSTLTLPDGATQVSYDGHPLYYFSSDKAPGEYNGQGLHFPVTAVTNPKGYWWMVSPSGAYITKTASSSSSSTSTTYSGY